MHYKVFRKNQLYKILYNITRFEFLLNQFLSIFINIVSNIFNSLKIVDSNILDNIL